MRDGWTPRVRWTLVVLAMVGLVACHGTDQPTTMPTPSPSRSASASPSASSSPSSTLGEQTLVDEAIAALTEYLALANEVENDGGRGWVEKLKPWWGSDEMIESGVSHFNHMLENGWHTEGSTELVEVMSTDYVESNTTVVLEYCLDARSMRVLDDSGTEPAHAPDHPFKAASELLHSNGRWLILDQQAMWEEQC